MIEVLGRCEQLEVLDCVRLPAGSVKGKFFDNCQRTFTSSVLQSVSDFSARTTRKNAVAIDRPHTDKVADVGYNPGCAGLDEQVVVKLRQIFFNHLGLFADDRKEGLERSPLFRVADTVNGWQELV